MLPTSCVTLGTLYHLSVPLSAPFTIRGGNAAALFAHDYRGKTFLQLEYSTKAEIDYDPSSHSFLKQNVIEHL